MAAPSYTTDLTVFNNCTSVTDWVEMTGMVVGGGADLDTDLGIYGDRCISELIRKTGLASLAYNNGSGVTIPTDGGFFVWSKYQAPNGVETRANGGIGIVIGSAIGTWGNFNMDGSDTYPYGGWTNYFVDPSLTPDSSSGTYNTTYQYCGTSIDVTNPVSKGNPQSIDIIRYGRGESRFTDGDLANGYATFDGFALVNDNATTGRFGLFQDQGGSYLWKGLMSLGLIGTSVDFRDSNVSIAIDDTIKASASFNRIEIHNSGSNIEWTSVLITKVGTVSKGEFEVIDNATVTITNCTFTDMSTFIFNGGTNDNDIDGSTFRRCALVTQGGATFLNCVFDEPSGTIGLTVDDLSIVTGNTFNSDGTGHAIDIGAITGDTAVSWNNSESGYVAGTAGLSVTTGTSGNETILCDVSSGQTLTINVGAGASIPSVKNDGTGDVDVVSSFDFVVTGLEVNTEVTIVTADTTTELFHVENASVSDGNSKYQVTYTHSGGGSVDVLIHEKSFQPDVSNIYALTLPSSDSSAKVQMFPDLNYFNP